MSRRKVVKRKGERLPGSNEVDEATDGLPQELVAEGGQDALKLLWRDLMADVGGLILNAFDADPRRFDEQKVEDRKRSYGLAVVALLGGVAVLLELIQSTGG